MYVENIDTVKNRKLLKDFLEKDFYERRKRKTFLELFLVITFVIEMIINSIEIVMDNRNHS